MDLTNFKLISSNQNKILEYKRLGLPVNETKGMDLPEVKSNINDIIVYKSKDAGSFTIVDDTILEVDGVEIIDIRWRVKDIPKFLNKPAVFIVSIAINDGTDIFVWRGKMEGTLVIPNEVLDEEKTFGFEAYICPMDTPGITLWEHSQKGMKDKYSARALAVKSLLNEDPILIKRIEDIPQWQGMWQK